MRPIGRKGGVPIGGAIAPSKGQRHPDHGYDHNQHETGRQDDDRLFLRADRAFRLKQRELATPEQGRRREQCRNRSKASKFAPSAAIIRRFFDGTVGFGWHHQVAMLAAGEAPNVEEERAGSRRISTPFGSRRREPNGRFMGRVGRGGIGQTVQAALRRDAAKRLRQLVARNVRPRWEAAMRRPLSPAAYGHGKGAPARR